MKTHKIPETAYERIFRNLYKAKVRYLVVGGVALNLYNVHRFTYDLDLMIDFEEQNVARFSKAVKSLGYFPRVPVKVDELADKNKRELWRKEKNAVVLTLASIDSVFPSIDIFLFHPINFHHAYKRRRTVSGGTFNISLIAPQDLLKLKSLAGREKDRLDLANLKREMEI